MTKVIAISNNKGGVAKTTSCVNIGFGLNLKKKKVLMIDLDAQCSLTQSAGLGNTQFPYTSYNMLRGQGAVQKVKLREGLDIIPASWKVADVELEIASTISRETLLRTQLATIKDQYDYVLFDCPPGRSLIVINAFVAADTVLIPLQAELLAYNGLNQIQEMLELIKNTLNPQLELGGIFITRTNERKTLNKTIATKVEKNFPGKLLKTRIRDNVDIAEAPLKKMDIFSYRPNSNGAEDYKLLVEEILKIYGGKNG
jgi:chromosome partitioning protein